MAYLYTVYAFYILVFFLLLCLAHFIQVVHIFLFLVHLKCWNQHVLLHFIEIKGTKTLFGCPYTTYPIPHIWFGKKKNTEIVPAICAFFCKFVCARNATIMYCFIIDFIHFLIVIFFFGNKLNFCKMG